MNPPFSSHALWMALFFALIAWRVLVRVRRLVGRQPVHRRRLVASLILFPLLFVAVGLGALRSVTLVEALIGGVVAGVALGFLGLRLTRFEVTPEGNFYRPNTVLGVGISLLFIGRLIYRFGSIYMLTGSVDPQTMQSFGSSPLTLALFGLVAAYYTTFSAGVLSWNRKARAARGVAIDPPAGTPAT
jgi:hypothetical protein